MPLTKILSSLGHPVEFRSSVALLCSASLMTAGWAVYELNAHAKSLPSTDSDYQHAQSLVQQKKWQEASLVLKSLWEAENASPQATIDLASSLMKEGKRYEAVHTLIQGEKSAPSAWRPVLRRRAKIAARTFFKNETFQVSQEGVDLLNNGTIRGAKEHFEKALRQEPDNLEILLRLSQAEVLENGTDIALKYLGEAEKIDPTEPEIFLWKGKALLNQGKYGEAILRLDRARKEMPKSEWPAVWLSEAYIGLGKRASALETLDQDVRAEPLHLKALVELAKLQAHSGVKDRPQLWAARKNLQLALSRLPEYGPPNAISIDPDDLSVDLRKATELRPAIRTLLQAVEARLENKPQDDAI